MKSSASLCVFSSLYQRSLLATGLPTWLAAGPTGLASGLSIIKLSSSSMFALFASPNSGCGTSELTKSSAILSNSALLSGSVSFAARFCIFIPTSCNSAFFCSCVAFSALICSSSFIILCFSASESLFTNKRLLNILVICSIFLLCSINKLSFKLIMACPSSLFATTAACPLFRSCSTPKIP